MAREKVEFDVIGRDNGGSKVFKDVGDAADKAGDKVDGVGKKFHGLDAEIEHTRTHMRNLASEIDKTGNKDLFKDLRKSQSELRRLMSVKNLLGDGKDNDHEAVKFGVRLGAKMAEGAAQGLQRAGGAITGAFGGVFESIPPQAQAAIGASVVAAVAATAPLIGGVVAGAIVGAAGVGGVVGGVAIAARNPAVQAEAAQLGKTFSDVMQRSAASFVPATMLALGQVESEVRGLEPAFADVFNHASGYLRPLTDGLLGAVRAFLPGLEDAVRKAGPVIDSIANGLVEIGSATGDLFSTMADHATEGGHALTMFFFILEAGIRTVTVITGALATMYGWMELGGALATHNVAEFARLRMETDANKQSSGGFSETLQRLISGFEGTGGAASTAAGQVESFDTMMRRLAGENIDAGLAQIQLREQMRATAEEITKHGRVVDANGNALKGHAVAADADTKRLLELGRQTLQTSDSVLKQTGSQEKANTVLQQGRAKFVELATSMGMSKTAADKLATSIFGIPSKREYEVKSNVEAEKARLAALNRMKLDNKTYYINGVYRPLNISGQGRVGGFANAEGGRIHGPGTDTSDDIVTRVSNGEYVIRAKAARAIGYDTLDALNQADRRPVASSASSSGGSSRPARRGDDERLVRLWRRAMDGMSIVLEDRTGRKAYLRARTGG